MSCQGVDRGLTQCFEGTGGIEELSLRAKGEGVQEKRL